MWSSIRLLGLGLALAGASWSVFANPGNGGQPLAVEPLNSAGTPDRASAVQSIRQTQPRPESLKAAFEGNQARRIGNLQAAETVYQRALREAVRLDALPDIWLASSNLLSLYSDPGVLKNSAQAILFGKLAINAFAGMRQVDGKTLPLYQPVGGLYDERPVQVYHQAGSQLLLLQRHREAEQVMRLYKQRELRELLWDSASPNSSDRLEPLLQLTGQELELLQQLALPPRPSGSLMLQADQSVLRFDPTAGQPSSSGEGLFTTPGESDPKAVVLHYFVTDQQISILLVSSKGSHVRTVSHPQRRLDQQVTELRTALANRLDVRDPSHALWKVLIGPVQDLLTEIEPHTLIFNLSGRLRYLPFAVLQDGQGRFLIQDYALVNATVDSIDRLKPAKPIGRVDALGLSQARLGQVALPGVRDELQSIIRSTKSPKGLLPGSMALDEEFTEARFNQALQGKHNVVHIATHFKFKPGSAKDSLLYLGQGGPLSLLQISGLNYSRIDLLTLSACDTAVGGGADENGMEVEGLAASVIKAGARTVLGSLWQVSDQSTGQLMKTFYTQRSLAQQNNAQALRQAQLQLLNDTDARFQHPFFWGAFVLTGGWS